MRGKMEEKDILLWLRILPYGTMFLCMIWILCLCRQSRKLLFLRQYAEFSGLLKEKTQRSKWYQRTEEMLKRKGAAYHYGEWVNPVRFLALKAVAAALGFAACIRISPIGAVCAGLCLYLLPGMLLHYFNKKDNEKMLPEIKLVYQAMSMQIQAGIYVTDALTECYSGVRDIRLRQALLKLAGDIVVKGDTLCAMEEFQAQFDNRHIDSLCITVLQALESGQAVELLNDIGEQLKDMETAILEKRKGNLDRSITFYQLGVLAAVLGVVLYACVSYMLGRALAL
ncbi:MAG: hypothetical protein NC251_07140 [Lachnoclostridium sp.]|nr:hypothetical protein [Lachnospira sp.]MCM1248186.1 hypothetical protein [Lachnoclostridium sp.]MCM1534469.1 hypothetical protein [Clostridium sp.]